MSAKPPSLPFFVIKAQELSALNFLELDYPRPAKLEWINRATNQPLRATTIDMLIRTLFRDVASPSVTRLHQVAGLRVYFRNEKDRSKFAWSFGAARERANASEGYVVVALFKDAEGAREAIGGLLASGFPKEAVSLISRAGNFLGQDHIWPPGHSPLSVAGATLGGGVLGAAFGVAVLAVPGVGLVALGGAIVASALSSIAAIGGVMGATGGAIAKMLTDHDVDGVAAKDYEEKIAGGAVFVSVDTRSTPERRFEVIETLKSAGGRTNVLR